MEMENFSSSVVLSEERLMLSFRTTLLRSFYLCNNPSRTSCRQCPSDVQKFQRIFFLKSPSCFFFFCGIPCVLPVVANQTDLLDRNLYAFAI